MSSEADQVLKRFLAEQKERVEHALQQYVPSADQQPHRLHEAIHYSLMAGGKRLRPILIIAAAQSVGGNSEKALPMACAMECIHTYSLIHDDLPAMDDDDLRRGQPTCHRKFDESTAILAGDALLTYAFDLAARPIRNVSPENQLLMIRSLAQYAGLGGMVSGQVLDLEAEGKQVDLDTLKNIHAHKTGALIRTSCILGAIIGGGSNSEVVSLGRYGHAIGLAFQIADDILDVVGDTATLGKPVGSDEKQKKSTYPQLMGLEEAQKQADQLVDEAVEVLASFGSEADPLRQLARYIVTRTH
ncbi:MAG: (2E,6E)-farnesyl diphosphate synthase [Magnetococcales bacterium]|nr:(2E,6E)-farnesyl diphosphate synthase [Magnetococcales bacterium]